MLTAFLATVDRVSKVLGAITMVMTAALVAIMSYEMFVRRILNSPTMWAFDLSYMLSGLIFIMACPYALLHKEHVCVDFLSTHLPVRVQGAVSFLIYATLFLPCIYIISQASVEAAYKAFVTGELERVSPWSPVIWPYYTGLAVGLCGLVLQTIAEMIRQAAKVVAPATAGTVSADMAPLAVKQL
jgi:TRAP-type mannitol/chloroaromatic compound transport system permease small subunit